MPVPIQRYESTSGHDTGVDIWLLFMYNILPVILNKYLLVILFHFHHNFIQLFTNFLPDIFLHLRFLKSFSFHFVSQFTYQNNKFLNKEKRNQSNFIIVRNPSNF